MLTQNLSARSLPASSVFSLVYKFCDNYFTRILWGLYYVCFRKTGNNSIISNLSISFQWLNGVEVMSHEGGHLPFERDITHALDYGGPNRLTVAVNNTLSRHTIPPGETKVEK